MNYKAFSMHKAIQIAVSINLLFSLEKNSLHIPCLVNIFELSQDSAQGVQGGGEDSSDRGSLPGVLSTSE